MEKTYEYKNGTITVELPESCDREELKRVTEDFLKKVIRGGNKNGYSYTSRNLNKQ
jgi:hypothetical protein